MKTQPRRLRFGPLKGSNSSQLVVELPNHSTAHLEKENRDPFLTRNSVKIQKGSTPHSLRTLQRVVRVKITNFVFSLKSDYILWHPRNIFNIANTSLEVVREIFT